MKFLTYSNKFVNLFSKVAEAGDQIRYESPFRSKQFPVVTPGAMDISPGYGSIWGFDKQDKTMKWLPAPLPWTQGELVTVAELDENEKENDPRLVPTIVRWYYIAEHTCPMTGKVDRYRFSTVYGQPQA